MATEAAEVPVEQSTEAPYISMLDSLKIVPEGGTPTPPPTEEKPPVETPPVQEEAKPPVEEKPADPENPFEQLRGTRQPKSEKAQENFKTLTESRNQERANREAAEKRAAELEAKLLQREQEFEEAKKNAANPDATAAEMARYQQEIQKRDHLLHQAQQELRAASIERDPQFIEKYKVGKQQRINQLQELAVAVGVSQDEFQRAIKAGDEDRLSEYKDSLPLGQRYHWDALRMQMAALDIEKEQELQNSDKAWENLQKSREEQFNQQRQQSLQANMQLANKVLGNYREKIPILKDDPELAKQVESSLIGLAGGEGADRWTPENIMGHIALLPVLVKREQQQGAIIQALQEENKAIADLKKKIEEQEQFIKSRYGGMGDADGGAAKPKSEDGFEDGVPLWRQVKVRT